MFECLLSFSLGKFLREELGSGFVRWMVYSSSFHCVQGCLSLIFVLSSAPSSFLRDELGSGFVYHKASTVFLLGEAVYRHPSVQPLLDSTVSVLSPFNAMSWTRSCVSKF